MSVYEWKIFFLKLDFIKLIIVPKILAILNSDKTLNYLTFDQKIKLYTNSTIIESNVLYYNKINVVVMDNLLCIFGFQFLTKFGYY